VSCCYNLFSPKSNDNVDELLIFVFLFISSSVVVDVISSVSDVVSSFVVVVVFGMEFRIEAIPTLSVIGLLSQNCLLTDFEK